MKEPLRLHINEDQHDLFASDSRTLLEVLREDIQLTGTKEVCNMGSCGTCTVLIDGQPFLSCLTLAHACKDKTYVFGSATFSSVDLPDTIANGQ